MSNPNLPDGFIEKVLLRVPDLGDLARFSATSKHWYNHISSKSFWQSRLSGKNDSFKSQVSFKMGKRKRKQVLSDVHYLFDDVRCSYEDTGHKRKKLVVMVKSSVHTLSPPNVFSSVREMRLMYFSDTNYYVALFTTMHPFPLIRLVVYHSLARKWSISEPVQLDLGGPCEDRPIINGCIFILDQGPKKNLIWCYSVYTNSWSKKELFIPESVGKISSMRLVDDCQKLYLTGFPVLEPARYSVAFQVQEDKEKYVLIPEFKITKESLVHEICQASLI